MIFLVLIISDVGVGIGYIILCVWGIDGICINIIVNGILMNDVESYIFFWVNMFDFVLFVKDI